MLPPEKRMGKAPPDSNWFDVVIAKETHEYQERALPPEKMLSSDYNRNWSPDLVSFMLIGVISDHGSHLIWSNVHHVV